MAKFYDAIEGAHRDFIEAQQMFFTASAPSQSGHVNVSPKGADTFRVLSPNQVCYLDLTGSGNETSAHLLQNGRITIMFCSFSRMAQIMRLFGTGRVAHRGTHEWQSHIGLFEDMPGARQIVFIDVEKVQTSCGYSVPQMDFVAHRETLNKWATGRGEEGLKSYRAEKNMVSLDGLPTGFIENA